MPTALAQTIAAKYKLDAERVDRVLRTDALTQTEEEIYQEVGKDLQDVSGGGIRYRSAEVVGPSRVEGVFTSTRDGKAYSFVWQSGKVTYQPVIAKTDSMTAEQHEIKWLARSIQLDNAGGETRVDSLRLHLDAKRNCGQGSYFCQAGGSGTCISVHKACSNDKQAVNHDRLNKINSLIEHLNNGGEHPSKALDKPDATKLQSVAEGIQKTRDLRAQNLQAKRTGDRLAQARAVEAHMKANYPELHDQIESAVAGYEKEHTRAKKALKDFKSMANSVDRAAKDIQAENAEQIANPAMLAAIRQKAKTEADRQILEESLKAKPPATMTVGEIAPSTKAPQLIPQSKAITPEVLPSEAPQGGAKKRIAGLLDKLQENHEAGTKNAAQISAVAHTALQGLDPTHTPKLSAPTATTYEAPKGSGRQRVAKLMSDLQANHEADVKNAAMTYAVAQSAVNQLKAQTGQKATPKQLSGQTGASGGGGAIDKGSVLMADVPGWGKVKARVTNVNANPDGGHGSYNAEVISTEAKNSKGRTKLLTGDKIGILPAWVESHNPPPQWKYEEYSPYAQSMARTHTREELQKMHDKLEKQQASNTASHLNAIERTTSMQSNSQHRAQAGNVVRGNYEQRMHLKNAIEIHDNYPEKAKQTRIESAPLAPTTKSRKAGDDPNYKGKYGHITIDSITGAIARLQQHGTHIDSDTALELLRKADDCGCDECQHRDEMSKYDRLVKSLAAKGADDPKALAAAIGRRKLGKKEFQRRAKAGKRKKSV